MDIEESVEFVDHLALTTTGKHLDSLQKAILRGAWDNQKYKEIAQRHHRSEKYVKEVGFKLWKLLSVALGEEQVSKANFRAKLENLRVGNISLFGNGCIHIGNISAESLHSPEVSQSEPQDKDKFNEKSRVFQPKIHLNLGDAPEPNLFYNRTHELTTLQQWIIDKHCRLVAILGLSGIGKTALTLHLLPQIQHQFEYVIWRSLRTSPPLETTLKNLIKFISNQAENELPVSTDDRLSILIDYLRSHRCLIILDDVQTILSSGQIAGNYRPESENYGTLFRLIAEIPHNSCLILNSWEPPREIAALTGETAPVRTLYLGGLGIAASEILKDKGLLEDENWPTLINTYRGNPFWLKIVATTIQELFNGRVAEFLQYDILFIGEELKAILHQQFNRLSDLEKEAMYPLANAAQPVSISQLLEDTHVSPSELINAIQSLGRRSFIERNEQENKMLFTLSPVIQEYVKSLVIRNG